MGSADSLPTDCAAASLVTAVNALHWFPDHERFFQECRRVLAPGGVLAAVTCATFPSCLVGQVREEHSNLYLYPVR